MSIQKYGIATGISLRSPASKVAVAVRVFRTDHGGGFIDARLEIPSQHSGSQGYPSRRDSIRIGGCTPLFPAVGVSSVFANELEKVLKRL
jgi:hypothetical protein